MSNKLFSIAFLPPVEYFCLLLNEDEIWIEKCEYYIKQSYRNRTNILSGNGVLSISVPVVYKCNKMLISEVKIDYSTDWHKKSWKTIESAYKSSPYFLYYLDFLYPFFEKKYDTLFDYNMQLLKVLFKLLNININISFTNEFIKDYPHKFIDLRSAISPKKKAVETYNFNIKRQYSQVFSTRFGFVNNLSIIDLLFNMGNESIFYLKQQQLL